METTPPEENKDNAKEFLKETQSENNNALHNQEAVEEVQIDEPDFFDRLGKKAIWLALGLAACIATYVYWDFITLQRVLLYTDIGSDSVNIFYPFWAHYSDLWREQGVPSYTLQWGMGNNVAWGLLMDPISLIFYMAGKENIPYMIGFMEVTKILLSVIFIFLYLKFLNLKNLTCIIGSLLFAFSGYLILGSSGWYIHSLEALMVAFFLYISEKFLNKNSWYWVTIFSFILAWTNFILFFQIFIVFAAYIFFRNFQISLTIKNNIKITLKAIFAFIIGGFIAFLPLKSAFSSIFNSGRSDAIQDSIVSSQLKQTKIFTLSSTDEYYSIFFRFLSNNVLGTGDNYKGWLNYLESPILYMGLPTVLFIGSIFMFDDKRQKNIFLMLLIFCIILLIFPWFRYAYWGFNLNYFRSFGYFITVILFFISIHGLDYFFKQPKSGKTILILVGLLIFVLFIFPGNSNGKIDTPVRMLIGLIISLYGVLIYMYQKSKNQKEVKWLILVLVVIELGLQSATTVNKRNTLSNSDLKEGKLYSDKTPEIINYLQNKNKEFYRIAKYYPSGPAQHMSMNDAMLQGFNGLIGYSSLHQKYYMRFLRLTGCIDINNPDDLKWTYKILSRPYLCAFAGAKYFLDKDSIKLDKNNFTFQERKNGIFIYDAKISLPIAVAYDQYITEKEFERLSNINKDFVLFNALVINEKDLYHVKHLKKFNLNDTITKANKVEFFKAAEKLKNNLTQNLSVSNNHINGEIKTNTPCIISIQIPFDKKWNLSINEKLENHFLGNIGFVCFKPPIGKSKLELKY